jgi:hypothetical protein
MRDREPARVGADNVGLREPPIMLDRPRKRAIQ